MAMVLKTPGQSVMMSFVRYIIAMIMIIKIFQFRHPDLTANAYKVVRLEQQKKILLVRFSHLWHWSSSSR